MEKEQFIKDKIKKLKSEGYSNAQSYAISLSMFNKMQQGGKVNGFDLNQKPIKNVLNNVMTEGMREGNLQPGYYTRVDYEDGTKDYIKPSGIEILYKMPNYMDYVKKVSDRNKKTQYPTSNGKNQIVGAMQQGGEKKEYYQMAGQYMDTRQRLNMYSNPIDFSIHNPAQPQQNYYDNNNPMFMTQGREQIQPLPTLTPAEINNTIPKIQTDTEIPQPTENNKSNTNINYNDRVNIMNDPFGGVSMEYALNTAGAGFGSGNYGQAAAGTGLSLIKGVRNFMDGYARRKETQRVGQEMMDRRFEDDRIFNWAQQGGKMRNADILAQKAITDQGQGNIEVEDGEYKKDAMTGQVMPIVGEKHQENGKYKGGVKIKAKEGDKFLADYGKAPKEVVSEFSDTFGIKAKKGSSYAELLKTLERGIGQTKLEKEKADKIIALEKAQKTEDKATKELNVNAIQKAIAKTNEKINTLSGVRDEAFEFLFNKQESYPKKGNGQLLDDNGNPIDTNEMVAQQGGMIGELAKKHNIPLERAMQLMQEGGEMMPEQEQGGQEEQIMQMVAQLLQQGASPEEVVQQLVSQGVPQEMAIQAVEMIMQQSQGQEQMMPQEQAPMQQGGKKDDIDNYILSPDFNRQELFTNQPYTRELGDKGWLSGNVSDENITERIRLQRQRLPYLTDNFFPSEDVKQADIEKYQKSYNDYLNSAEKAIDKNKNLTDEQKNKLKERLKTERFDSKQTARDFDKKYGNFTSSRVGVALPLITKKDREKYPNLKFINDAIDKNGNIKEEYKDLSNEAKQNIKATQEDGVLNRNIGILDYGDSPQKPTKETPADLQQFPDQPATEARDRVINVMSPRDYYNPILTPPQAIGKFTPVGGLKEGVKQTIEPYLAEQARQYNTEMERLRQTGLTSQQMAGMSAQGLAASQLAANDAISKVEGFNAQVDQKIHNMNTDIDFKNQILGAQANSDYQDKVFMTQNNYIDSLNNAGKENFYQKQEYDKRDFIANVGNLGRENVAVIPGQGLMFLDNDGVPKKVQSQSEKDYIESLSPQQRILYSRMIAKQYGTS